MNVGEVLDQRGLKTEELAGYKEEFLKWDKMDELVEEAQDMLMDITKIGVLYDVDADGLVSGKIIEEGMQRLGLMVARMMNTRKKHGITEDVIEWVKKERIELLYVVDGGTNDIEEHRILSEMGVKVIVLDHHEQWRKEEIDNVWVVNCSLEKDLPDLSGAGVCFRFLEKLDREIMGMGVRIYEPWVGLTVLSDHCSMLDKENRYYVDRLYEDYDKIDLFKAFPFWGSKRNLFLFGVIPFLNACIRTNHVDWAMDAVLMTGEANLKNHVKDKREQVLEEQKEVLEKMRSSSQRMTGKSVMMYLLSDEHLEYTGMSGLLANKYLNETGKSALVLYREEGYLRGSFRGEGSMEGSDLEKLGWKVMGHPQAAGVELKVDEEANKVLDRTQQVEAGEKDVGYDFEMDDSAVFRNMETLREIARFNERTGKGVETIKVCIKTKRSVNRRQRGKKVEYDYGSFEVRDFNLFRGIRKGQGVIVEPLLDSKGIVLLRSD